MRVNNFELNSAVASECIKVARPKKPNKAMQPIVYAVSILWFRRCSTLPQGVRRKRCD